MGSAIRDTLHKMAEAMGHLWLTQTYLATEKLPPTMTLYVYQQQLGWGIGLLDEHRIKITIEVERH